MPWGPPPGPGEGPSRMILGAAYNVFDNEELLEASVRSIRSEVDFVAIVYQRTSNFGAPCSAELMPTLGALRDIGLVDELIEYAPRTFTLEEKTYADPRSSNPGLAQTHEPVATHAFGPHL